MGDNDTTLPYLSGLNSQFQSVLARTYNKDGKFEWFDDRANRNVFRFKDGNWDGIPFKTKFAVLKNGTHKIDDPVYICPNGMASWY